MLTRSVLGIKVMDFADRFDMAFAINHDFPVMIGKTIALNIITNSFSLIDVLAIAAITTERRHMIDLQSSKESYNRIETGIVAFVRSDQNLADPHTKLLKNPILEKFLNYAKLDHPI